MTKTPWQVEHALKKAKEAVDTMAQEYAALLAAANAKTGVIMPVKTVSEMGGLGSITSYARESLVFSWASDRDREATVALARKRAEEAIACDRAVHAENAVALENNKRLCADISALMTNAGIPRTYRRTEWKRNRSVIVDAVSGWSEDLRRLVKTDDGIETSERLYAERLRAIDSWNETALVKELEEKRKKDAEAAKLLSQRELAVALVKYDLPATGTWKDVLDKVLDKNKYLRLAVMLEKNRADWSDGDNYARRGIEEFAAETPEDKDIERCILSHCGAGWGGDGRIFRDCEYNYTVLFAKVPAEIMAEYEAVLGKAD